MTGIMCLYITNNSEIYKIPIPNGNIYKAIPSLSNQYVLFSLLYYETVNRKPVNLILANFDRLKLDCNGGYEFTIDEIKRQSYNFDNYGYTDSKELSQKDCIPIPQATVLPTKNEKEVLYNYIREKFPSLWDGFSERLESYIQNCINNDLARREMVRKAFVLKYNIK